MVINIIRIDNDSNIGNDSKNSHGDKPITVQ